MPKLPTAAAAAAGGTARERPQPELPATAVADPEPSGGSEGEPAPEGGGGSGGGSGGDTGNTEQQEGGDTKADPTVVSAPAKKVAKKTAAKPAKKTAAAAAPESPGELMDSEFGAPLAEGDEYINACYYGLEGTGKTTDVAFMANLGRVLFINAESGAKVRRLRQLGVNVDNIRVWPDRDKGETVTFDGLETLFWRMQAQLMDHPGSWAGTVWDSLSEIHKLLLDNIVARQFERITAAGKSRDRFFIDRSDYGEMAEQVRTLIRRFRDLPCHFAMTALERRDVDDDGSVRYGPAVTPALMTDIPGFVDVLIHKYTMERDGEPVYVGQTRQVGKYRAKDRWYATPKNMVYPNFERLHAYVTEQLDSDTDPMQVDMREWQAQVAAAASTTAEAAGGGGKLKRTA